jgi:hypothetical protein
MQHGRITPTISTAFTRHEAGKAVVGFEVGSSNGSGLFCGPDGGEIFIRHQTKKLRVLVSL